MWYANEKHPEWAYTKKKKRTNQVGKTQLHTYILNSMYRIQHSRHITLCSMHGVVQFGLLFRLWTHSCFVRCKKMGGVWLRNKFLCTTYNVWVRRIKLERKHKRARERERESERRRKRLVWKSERMLCTQHEWHTVYVLHESGMPKEALALHAFYAAFVDRIHSIRYRMYIIVTHSRMFYARCKTSCML